MSGSPEPVAGQPPQTVAATPDIASPAKADTALTGNPQRSTQPASGTTPGGLPEVFGRYEIRRLLGKGGMGAVYLAHDPRARRDVALKIPHFPEGSGPEVIERFYREVRTAATLQHPNICPIWDVDEVKGVPYVTMPFIEGQSLDDVIRKPTKPLPERQVVALVRKAALAMAEAHGKQIVHRDLKPANIMLDRRKEPVVMDFGLARRASSGEARITKSGTIVGTPAYMPIEQVKGQDDLIGPATDVYSLGVILYELLTGRVPFDGPSMAVIGQILTQEPPPPSQHRPDLDRSLERICLTAMAKQPQDRYRSMGEFAKALADWLKGEPSGASATVIGAVGELSTGEATPPAPWFAIDTRDSSKTTRPLSTRRSLPEWWRNSPPWGKWIVYGGVVAVLFGLIVILRNRDGSETRIETDANSITVSTPSGTTEITATTPAASTPAPSPGGQTAVAAPSATNGAAGSQSPAPPVVSSNSSQQVISAAAPDFRPAVKSLAIRYPYVYGLEEGDSKADLWVYRLPDDLEQVSSPKVVARLVRPNVRDDLQPLLNARYLVPEIHPLAQIPDAGTGGGLILRGKHLYVPRSGRVEVYDLDDPARPKHIGQFGSATSTTTYHVVAHGDRLYLCNRNGLGVFDISNAERPRFVGHVSTRRAIWTACVIGNFLYASFSEKTATGDDALAVFDVSNPDTPIERSSSTIWTAPYKLLPTRSGGLMVLTGDRGQFYDLSNPLQPTPMGAPYREQCRTAVIAMTDHEYLITEYRTAVIKDLEIVPNQAVFPSGGVSSGLPYHGGVDGDIAVIPSTRGSLVLRLPGGTARQSSSTTVPRPINLGPSQPVVSAGSTSRPSAVDVPQLSEDRAIQMPGSQFALLNDGHRAVFQSGNEPVLIDLESGTTVRTFVGNQESTFQVAVSPDGRYVAGGGGSGRDPVIKGTNAIILWDVESGEERGRLVGHGGQIRSLAFSPDGKRLSSGSNDSTVRIWETKSFRQEHVLALRGTPSSVGFSPDGTRVVSNGDGVQVWDVQTGAQEQHIASIGGTVFDVAYFPDGQRVALGGTDDVVHIVEIATGQETQRLTGHQGDVYSIDVSKDGRRVLSGGADSLACLWDVTTGRQLGILKGHTGIVRKVAFSADSRFALSAADDGDLRQWRLPEEASFAPVPDADRAAAEWALALYDRTSVSAPVSVRWIDVASPGGIKDVHRVADLPNKPFRVVRLRLQFGRAQAREVAHFLAPLNELEALYLHGSQAISPAVISVVAEKNTLQELGVSGAGDGVGDQELAQLAALPNLTYLGLHDSVVSDAGLEHLAKLTQLRTLFIPGTNITDDGMTEVARCSALSTLSVDNTLVGDNGVRLLSALPLTILHVKYCPITDVALGHIGQMQTLQVLTLSETEVTDAGLLRLSNLHTLRDLHLSGTKVTAEGVARLKASLPKLRTVTIEADSSGSPQSASQ